MLILIKERLRHFFGARSRRFWLSTAALMALTVLCFPLLQSRSAHDHEYLTATVERGRVEKTITALGILEPKEYVDVGTQVSGQLQRLHVDTGDAVTKDQLLAEIDPKVYESRVRTARAEMENMKAQLVLQRAELQLARQRADRNQRLYEQKAVSEDTFEASKTEVTVAEARITALQAQIDSAQATLDGDITNLGYTKIYAPMAGTIVSVSAIEGQTLNANQTAPIIVRIANLGTMTVRAQVSEADVVRITPEMPAYFSTLGMPERRWRGSVRKILPTPETVNDVVLYSVLADVDNVDGALMTSMTAQVFFIQGSAYNALRVPASALKPMKKTQTGTYAVELMTRKGPERRQVEVGLVSRTHAEILSGLEEGQQVIVGMAMPEGPAQARGPAGAGGMRMRGSSL